MAFPEYPGAIAYPAEWGHASDREGTDIDTIIVHCMVGYFDSAMRFLQTSPNYSCHYGVAQDGRIGQGVSEQWAAWHAGNWPVNLRSIGIEHEDMAKCEKEPWMTREMFQASTRLSAHLCRKYHIRPSRIILHRTVASDGRSCPGPFWPTRRYRVRVAELLEGSA